VTILPARNILGTAAGPGDKSISHRYALLGGIARGRTTIRNFSAAADCHSTLECLRALGIAAEADGATVTIEGRGLYGLRAPAATLDAGNSGSTMRMIAGILAAQPFDTEITGDESLRRRPMRRIIEPLAQMGARIEAHDGRAPLRIHGGKLRAIRYRTPVASAQVKSAVLLAGLYAEGTTTVEEEARTRDHTEIALREFGARVEAGRGAFSVTGGGELSAATLTVPGDISSAAFFLAAALLFPESNLTIANVGLNPTRAAILDLLRMSGADIGISNLESLGGELVGDLHVRGGRRLRGLSITAPQVPGLIDEIPVLAVLGAAAAEGFHLSGAGELRVKESDRLATVAENLRRMGVAATERPDGLEIAGGQKLRGATITPHGDHRIAMAFAVAALAAQGETRIEDAACAKVSFPQFYEVLNSITEQ
jgi:3-phosphoshikimate 1-carboxyvinyltransferase